MSSEQIIDIRIDKNVIIHEEHNLTLIRSDGTEFEIDYIKATRFFLTILERLGRETDKKQLLEVINKIYTENSKLKMLGSTYPVYRIRENAGGRPKISLIGFGNTQKESKYTVKDFVTDVWIDDEIGKVSEITFKHPIEVNSLGINSFTKINGLEYIKSIHSRNRIDIALNVERYYDTELRLKYLEIISIGTDDYYSYEIKKLIMENTCSLTDIPITLFSKLPFLEEMQLCESIKTIDDKPLSEYIKQNEDGEYIQVYKPMYGVNHLVKIIKAQ